MRRHDFGAGKRVHRGAHRGEDLDAEMPTVRNFRPLKSSALVIGFLYQPSGSVGIGP